MDKKFAINWFQEHFDANSINVGSQLLLSLAIFAEETRPYAYSPDNPYIKLEDLPELLIRLKNKGWSEVTITDNLFHFIADVDDVLTVLAFE